MISRRIIPCLKINNKKELICTENFKKRTYVGDPINAISIFNEFNVDELVLIDIDSSKENRLIDIDYVKKIAEEFEHPLIVGGGVSTLSQIELLLNSGADRVLISNSIIHNKEFLKEAVKSFGKSTITVCIDYYVNKSNKKKLIFDYKKNQYLNIELKDHYLDLINKGMGECLLQSIDKDGSMTGFDFETIKYFNANFTNPLVCLGGCGKEEDISSLIKQTNISAISVGSAFCFFNSDKQVLINYPEKN